MSVPFERHAKIQLSSRKSVEPHKAILVYANYLATSKLKRLHLTSNVAVVSPGGRSTRFVWRHLCFEIYWDWCRLREPDASKTSFQKHAAQLAGPREHFGNFVPRTRRGEHVRKELHVVVACLFRSDSCVTSFRIMRGANETLFLSFYPGNTAIYLKIYE